MEFEDILYELRNGVAWITINRPDKMNAFRGQTCDSIFGTSKPDPRNGAKDIWSRRSVRCTVHLWCRAPIAGGRA